MAQSKALVKTEGKLKKLSEWVDYICAAWQDSVRSIIETGRRINDAMDALPRGSKEKLYDQLPFSETTAKRLRTIAGDARLTSKKHQGELPPYWYTLYELTKLDDKSFKKAMDMGKIHPDMERSDAEALLAKSKPKIDKATVEDAEVIEQEDEGNEEPIAPARKRSEPEPAPASSRKGPVQKTSLEIAFDNYENSLDSLIEFAEKFEEAIEASEREIDFEDDLIERTKNLGAFLTRFAKKLG